METAAGSAPRGGSVNFIYLHSACSELALSHQNGPPLWELSSGHPTNAHLIRLIAAFSQTALPGPDFVRDFLSQMSNDSIEELVFKRSVSSETVTLWCWRARNAIVPRQEILQRNMTLGLTVSLRPFIFVSVGSKRWRLLIHFPASSRLNLRGVSQWGTDKMRTFALVMRLSGLLPIEYVLVWQGRKVSRFLRQEEWPGAISSEQRILYFTLKVILFFSYLHCIFIKKKIRLKINLQKWTICCNTTIWDVRHFPHLLLISHPYKFLTNPFYWGILSLSFTEFYMCYMMANERPFFDK